MTGNDGTYALAAVTSSSSPSRRRPSTTSSGAPKLSASGGPKGVLRLATGPFRLPAPREHPRPLSVRLSINRKGPRMPGLRVQCGAKPPIEAARGPRPTPTPPSALRRRAQHGHSAGPPPARVADRPTDQGRAAPGSGSLGRKACCCEGKGAYSTRFRGRNWTRQPSYLTEGLWHGSIRPACST
jgi:hypothetical protein